MTRLYGRDYTRSELLRRVGRLDQVAGVRLVTLEDGAARGVRVLEFRTGGGLSFDVLVDRAFDVGRCDLDGASLCWQSNPGVVGPWYYEPEGWGWFRSWGGGMVVTCGLDHTLGPGEDTAVQFNQPHVRTTDRTGCTAGSAASPPASSGTASAGRATSASSGRRARSSSRWSTASTCSSAGGSRRAWARPASGSMTWSRTWGTPR